MPRSSVRQIYDHLMVIHRAKNGVQELGPYIRDNKRDLLPEILNEAVSERIENDESVLPVFKQYLGNNGGCLLYLIASCIDDNHDHHLQKMFDDLLFYLKIKHGP